jgi:inner membrane protein
LGISDLRGLQGDLAALWNTERLTAEAGLPGAARLPRSGIHWPITASSILQGDGSRFEISFKLRGSSRLSVVPVGKSSLIDMKGDWQSPSFNGRTLPAEREVTEAGFSARWDVFHLSRPLPQRWVTDIGAEDHLAEDGWDSLAVGTSFLQPVDFYLLSERSTKYGLLVVALLFLTYFLFEVLAGATLHPLQYLMVGAALVLFFLSLVAFAEVIGFAAAYAVSGGLVVAMISLYTGAILKRRWAWLLCVVVTGLYAIIYLILILEEVALLAGALVLFAALGLTMFATRNVDWFNTRKAEAPRGPDVPPTRGESSITEAAL